MTSDSESKEQEEIFIIIMNKIRLNAKAHKLFFLFFAVILFSASAMAVTDGEGYLDRSQSESGESSMRWMSKGGQRRGKSPILMMQASLPKVATSFDAIEDVAMIEMDGGVQYEARSTSSSIGLDHLKSYDEEMKKIPTPSGDQKRMLVHSGNLSLNTKKGELTGRVDAIETMVKDSKGYIESKNSYKQGRNSRERSILDLNMRIPSDVFHSVVKKIQDLVGEKMVTNISINSRDVTDEFVDASSRADTLEASRNALQLLMAKAANVKEVMEVQSELNRVTQEFESQKRSAQYLQKQSDLSSLAVHIEELIEEEPSDQLGPFFSPYRSLNLALTHMAVFGIFVVETIIYAAVWIFPLGIILSIALLFRKQAK